MEIEIGDPKYSLEVLEWIQKYYPADQHHTPDQQGRRPGHRGILEWVAEAIAEIRKNDALVEARLASLDRGFYEFTARLGLGGAVYIDSKHKIHMQAPGYTENDFRWALIQGCVWRLDRTTMYLNYEESQEVKEIDG